MKITYDIIKENLRVFEEAKTKFPIIQKYIDGEVSSRSLMLVGLTQFASFYDYLKFLDPRGDLSRGPIINDMTWRKLKPILIEKTDLPRFKTYLKNRTQKDFCEILKDVDVYDRLLNGRWLRRPARRSSGRRSGEKINSFNNCSVEIINYIIQNEVDVCDNIAGIQWFVTQRLSLDESLVREMKVTEDMLKSIADVITESKIDFKKLNLDYITNSISEKLGKLIHIEKDSVVKCIRDVESVSHVTGNRILAIKEGNSYTVNSSQIRNGYLYLWLNDETGRNNYYAFSNFEDMQYHRNSILDSLFS